MMTFKQLEAVYWVVQLGGFAQAAKRLHTSQSAVSKRIQEIEAQFETSLFDRSLRTARPTAKGMEMFVLARGLLEQRDAAVEQFLKPETVVRHVRIGVTELTAMTWLPRLVGAIRQRYPKVVIEPYVDSSKVLRDKLLADDLDLAIMPEVYGDQRFAAARVGVVENAWMCKPGLVGTGRPIRIGALAAHRLLTQDERSGTGLFYGRWLQSHGVVPGNQIFSNSVVALIGLAVSGMGVSYLPLACLMPMVESGALQVLKVSPALPPAPYAAMRKTEPRGSVIATIVQLAREQCAFGRIFQTS